MVAARCINSSPAPNARGGQACIENVPPLNYVNDAGEEKEVAALPDPHERNIQWMMADMVEKLGGSVGIDAQEYSMPGLRSSALALFAVEQRHLY